ncbi:hypothetical protein KKHLCK_11260 [Candidatus Electrothrix laxa]
MKIIIFITYNLLLGNLITGLFISSNFFLQSLMVHFRCYFHLVFSILLFVFFIFFLKQAKIKTTRPSHCLYGFSVSFLPVILTILLLLAIPFIPASIRQEQTIKGIVFIFKFTLVITFTTGALYWIPFSILNTLYMRKIASNKELQKKNS